MTMHYTGTADGRPACDGYLRDVPDTEPSSWDRAAVPCVDCLALIEEPYCDYCHVAGHDPRDCPDIDPEQLAEELRRQE